MTTKCQKCGIIWNDELDECLNCGSIISAPLIPDASVSDLDAEEFSKQTGVATTDPFASYSSRTSFALTILGSVGVFLLGSIGWVLSPIGIALIVPCYGVGIYYLASSISKWNKRISHVNFYFDRIEIVTKDTRRNIAYSEIEKLIHYQQRVYLTFTDETIRGVYLPDKLRGNIRAHDILTQKIGINRTKTPRVDLAKVSSYRRPFNLLISGFSKICYLFAIEIVSVILVSSLPFLPGEQATYDSLYKQTESSFANLSAFSTFLHIFLNNEFVALHELVPFWGVLTFSSSTYNTARVAQVIAITRGVNPALLSFSLFAYPHTWIELSSYVVALYFGFHILRYGDLTLKGRPTWREFGRELSVMLALISGMLLLSTALEVGENIIGTIIAWIVVAAIGLGLLLFRRRVKSLGKGTPSEL